LRAHGSWWILRRLTLHRLSKTVLLSCLCLAAQGGPLVPRSMTSAGHDRLQAPSGCPARSEVEADVVRLLGARSTGQARRPWGESERRSACGRPLARRALDAEDGRSGERELEAESCAALASATALIVAMMIDPDAMRRVDASVSTRSSQRALLRPDRTTHLGFCRKSANAVVFVARIRRAARRCSGRPGATLAAAAGARLGVGRGGLLVGLEGLYSAETLGQSEADPALRGKFALWTAGVRACQTSGGPVVALAGAWVRTSANCMQRGMRPRHCTIGLRRRGCGHRRGRLLQIARVSALRFRSGWMCWCPPVGPSSCSRDGYGLPAGSGGRTRQFRRGTGFPLTESGMTGHPAL